VAFLSWRSSGGGTVSDPIVFVDSSEVAEGKLEELRQAVGELARFVEANESDPIAYHVYFSSDGQRMTVVQIHPDSMSMEHHMELAGPIFARLAHLVELQTVDIYGTPSGKVVEQLRRKAELLGTATVTVHEREVGFDRLVSRLAP
jgi:hypothetical protein